MRKGKALLIAALAVAVVGLVGCGQKAKAPEGAGAPASPESAQATTPTTDTSKAMAPAPGSTGKTVQKEQHSTAPTSRRTRGSGGGTEGAVPAMSTGMRGTIVPAGTEMTVTLNDKISTETAKEGDAFTGVLASAVVVDGKEVFPSGAKVEGHVAVSERAPKSGGRSHLQLAYDRVVVKGLATELHSVGAVIEGKSGTSGDVKRIGGGAAAGAVIGGILGGKSGAVKGAVVGGAAGTAASMASRGPDVDLAAGATTTVKLDVPVRVGGTLPEAVRK